ncbi:hypothetical protein EUGRSUZ_L00476 [Eucalyptus grandis]|uniref:Uncharacterized protein n=1 Tax=Eucalyptus grandis TaxID=71139 RepID=A0A058ZXE5_EUCGR|nr:hypothetical protein EUGRSUZ_L00476 [Eucalyptus grandis]
MTRGGCSASVKRILENHPQIPAASVNLTAETAVIWPLFEAKTVHTWQREWGETVAKHLTNCGFKSNPRGKQFYSPYACCSRMRFGCHLGISLLHRTCPLSQIFCVDYSIY